MDVDNNDVAILLGKILGEIYRSQKASGVPMGKSDGHVYGLLNGFEEALNAEFVDIGFISKEQSNAVDEVLDEYFNGDKELSGFYDIEHTLSANGVSRSDAIRIFKYLKADNRYGDLMEKMDSGHSPMECRNLDLSDCDK